MADWVAFTVLDRLDVSDMAPERTLILDAALAWLRRGDVRLDLGALGEPGRFLDHAASDGAVPTYRLAFLLADRLITRYGLAKVAEYFRAFRASPDEALNFERAFGLRVGEFEGEVLGLPGASPAPVPLAHGGQGERG
jgi:hypothetical protein